MVKEAHGAVYVQIPRNEYEFNVVWNKFIVGPKQNPKHEFELPVDGYRIFAIYGAITKDQAFRLVQTYTVSDVLNPTVVEDRKGRHIYPKKTMFYNYANGNFDIKDHNISINSLIKRLGLDSSNQILILTKQ